MRGGAYPHQNMQNYSLFGVHPSVRPYVRMDIRPSVCEYGRMDNDLLGRLEFLALGAPPEPWKAHSVAWWDDLLEGGGRACCVRVHRSGDDLLDEARADADAAFVAAANPATVLKLIAAIRAADEMRRWTSRTEAYDAARNALESL